MPPVTAPPARETASHPPAAATRTVDVDVSDLRTSGRTVSGYAAVYGVESRDLGGFRETIAPGAFAAVLDGDVRCLLNHDPNIVLGRTRAGTLRLTDEQRGLRFECDLPEARADLREAIERGDIDGASFHFEVAPGGDTWAGEVRSIQRVGRLHDVSIATHPAYPSASVELRSRAPAAAPSPSPGFTGGGLTVRDRSTVSAGETRREPRSLAGEFRAAGFPGRHGERAVVDFDRMLATGRRALTQSGAVDELNVTSPAGLPLGFDERWVFAAVPRVGVDDATTAVSVVSETARTLATPTNVIRAIDAVTDKPETDMTINLVSTALKQVASVVTNIPNIYLAQPGIDNIIETDLRWSIYGGLDKLVLDFIATAGFQAPGSDVFLVSARKAMTTIQSAGYNPDTLILTPAAAESLDTLVSGISGATADFVFGAGNPANGVFGLRRVVSKTIAASAVMDSSAIGRLYTSPVSLARFENDAGVSNTSNVRLELNALFGGERAAAAVRIAAS